MASKHPKIIINFRRNGKFENVEITWDSQEKITHISDIRKIIHEKPEDFAIPKNTQPEDIILIDFYGKQEVFDHERINRDLVLVLQMRTSSMNENVFSNIKSFLGKNDQFNARLAQRKKIPELEKLVNQKYIRTYKRVWKRIGWDWTKNKFSEDYFDDISRRNEIAISSGQEEIVNLPHINEAEINDFWKGINLRLINFGMIIMSENTSDLRLEEENAYWESLLNDNDAYWSQQYEDLDEEDIDEDTLAEIEEFNKLDDGIDEWNDNPY